MRFPRLTTFVIGVLLGYRLGTYVVYVAYRLAGERELAKAFRQFGVMNRKAKADRAAAAKAA